MGIGVSTEAAETASNFGLDAWLAIVSAQPANPLWAQKAPQIGPELQQFAPTACADGLRSDLQHPSARKKHFVLKLNLHEALQVGDQPPRWFFEDVAARWRLILHMLAHSALVESDLWRQKTQLGTSFSFSN